MHFSLLSSPFEKYPGLRIGLPLGQVTPPGHSLYGNFQG
jgi:hypothetical protein